MTTNTLSAVHDGTVQIHEQNSWQPLERHGTLVQSTQFHLFCLQGNSREFGDIEKLIAVCNKLLASLKDEQIYTIG
jgi:hypothetical protein